MIAGWDPDQTFWLTDCVRCVDDGTHWALLEEYDSLPSAWARV